MTAAEELNPFARYQAIAEQATTLLQIRHRYARIYHDRVTAGPIFRFRVEYLDGFLFSIAFRSKNVAGLDAAAFAVRLCEQAERRI